MEPGDLYQAPAKYTTEGGKVRWRYRIYLGPHKRVFRKGFRTKAEAERAYKKEADEVRRGVVVDRAGGRRPLSQWHDEWLKTNQLSASTRATAASVWHRWISPRLGDTPISLLTPKQVQTWIVNINQAGAGPQVQRQALAHLRRIVRVALACEALAADPAKAARVVDTSGSEAPDKGVIVLTPAHVAALMDAVPARYRLLLETLAVTGLRQGEAFGLSVGDLDLNQVPPRLWVRASWSPSGGGYLKATKTNKARVVALSSDTAARLAASVAGKGRGAPVFSAPGGGRISSSNFRSRVWLPAVAKVRAADPSLPDRVTPHELRHFYATTALTAGVDLVTVSKQLGHSATAVTADTYARWVPTAGAAAATAVADALGGVAGGTSRGHLHAVAEDKPSAVSHDDGEDQSSAGSDDGAAG
ncbi:site-specific integrase [Corynebacterium diphtheriae]|nr:site-specific integrase [Corynebacterium diphtheriae]